MEISPESLSSLLENVAEQMVLVSVPDFRILYANRAFTESAAKTLESIKGLPCHTATRDRETLCDEAGHDCPVKRAAESGDAVATEMDIVAADGRARLVEVAASPIRDESGRVTCVVEIVRERRSGDGLSEDLKRKGDFLEKILLTCPEGIIANDRQGNIFLFNASAERILGRSRAEVVGKVNVEDLYPPGAAREVKEFLYSERYGGRGRLVDFETEIVNAEGKRIPIRLCCSLLYDGGREVGTIGFFTDITARKLLQDRFLESEERFRGIFESARDGIVCVDEDGSIVMVNKAAEEILGYGAGELQAMKITDLFPARYGDTWKEIRTYASPHDPRNHAKAVELVAVHKSGRRVPIQVSLAEKSIRGRTFLTAIMRDISERKAIEEELRLLSITDSLTRLYNRRHFVSLAQKELDRAARNGTPFSILLIDVDRFKQYNDTYGHAEGDEVLRAMGELLARSFRTMDSCFRFGGEEFVVLLPETDAAGAMVAAERFRIRFSQREFHPAPTGSPVRLTVSVGIAEHHPGNTLDDLIRLADLAMYAAKNGGRDRTVSYEALVARAMAARPPSD